MKYYSLWLPQGYSLWTQEVLPHKPPSSHPLRKNNRKFKKSSLLQLIFPNDCIVQETPYHGVSPESSFVWRGRVRVPWVFSPKLFSNWGPGSELELSLNIFPAPIPFSPLSFISRFRFIQTPISRERRVPKIVPFLVPFLMQY